MKIISNESYKNPNQKSNLDLSTKASKTKITSKLGHVPDYDQKNPKVL